MTNYNKSSNGRLQKDFKSNVEISTDDIEYQLESIRRNPPKDTEDNDYKLFLGVYGIYFLLIILIELW